MSIISDYAKVVKESMENGRMMTWGQLAKSALAGVIEVGLILALFYGIRHF